MGNSERRKFSLIMDHNAIWLSLVLAIITFTTPAATAEPRVVCYYTNWSVYRPGTARFNPQNINPYLCTHLVYAFGGFTKDNTLKPFDKYQDIEKGGYAKFTGLKTYNKNLKTMLAIGGWNEGSSRFSPMVAAKERRREFVRNALKFLRQNRFDGLDLDWEYPAFRDGGKPKDRENYAKLVKELREEFEREAEKTGRPRLLLTMAVPAGIEYIQKGFDVKTLNQYLDWMNLLSYDYHSAFEPAVNHHAPLYPLEEPNEYSVDNELNIDYTIKFYLESGADADKLVLGIPTYGRSYTLFNPDATDIGAPADGPGDQGDATREKGYLAYYEICEALKPKKQKKRSTDDDDEEDDSSEEEEDAEDEPWTVIHPNPKAMGPVAYRGNQWVGYDDIDIVKKKAEYVAENGLGGIMFWSIDNDDFRGTCHGKPYPLIESAKEAYIAKLGSTDNVVVRERPKSGTSSSSRRRNRPRTTSTTTTVKPSTGSRSNKRKNTPSSSLTSSTPSWNIVTPEPPTTPDPGSDFKCTDEGFFPHPRDCKKYFWCLDSGPSNLGIVAHHFTCPSGLFFNKAADSCDFARNVLCKKPAATTKAPATKAPTTEAPTTTTTTRRPVKLSTKNSALFRTTTTTTTTTTTPEPEEEEYEDDIEEDSVDVEAEDPKVIKELIDLIKKVGGVEQLEKQLHLAESTMSSDGAATTKPPAAINKKLIQNVLERTRTTNRFSGSNSLSSGSQNSRRGPQNAGIQSASADSEAKPSRRDGRPQYTTINRNRGTTSTTPEPEEDLDSVEEPEVPQVLNRARAVDSDVRAGSTTKPLQYVNIRRPRPTSDTADDTASRNALFERVEPFVSVSDTSNTLDVTSARRENTPEYVTIRRQRPTTEEPTTVQYQNTEPEESSFETILEKEISSPPSQPQYNSIVRTRSTTLPPTEESSSPEPTTVLAVQISSLLNAPNPEDTPMNIIVESEQSAETTEVTEPPTTPTTTTTTTTTAAPSGPPRRTVLRRRGSTTTTTTSAPSSSTMQVSERNYSFVSRRRPLSRPNEISSDSEENSNSRKIRSTTPDSRELDSGKVNGETQTRQSVVQSRRFRSRYEQTQAQDSVPAAATPVSRGQFRPRLNQDELVSLAPVETGQDVAPQFVPRDPSASRNVRRFRGRTFTTIAENVADSEVSAATVEVQRQNTFVPRGRSRFVSTTTTEEPAQASEPPPKRPTLTRFSPRPFSRAITVSTTEESFTIKSEDEQTVAPRLPTRLPFGRQRTTSASTSTLKPEIQPRRLPFPSRITTQQTLSEEKDDEEIDDEEIEDKNEDIHLSESAIEEKEHDDSPLEEPEAAPKSRRVVIKKFRPSSTTEQDLVDTTSELPIATDETGRKKFRVIRRRPTSTTIAATEEEEIVTTVASEAPSSTPTRIRKVIRKKIQRLVEEEPEIIAKSVGSVNAEIAVTETVANYGEKTRPTISVSSVPSLQTEQEQESVSEVTESIKPVSETDEENDEKVQKVKQTEEASLEKNKEEEKEQTAEPETATKPEIVVEINENAINLPENKNEVSSEAPLVAEEQESPQPETTTASTTKRTTTASRARLPYRPPKRPFTTSTESPTPSSRTYSRKYNAGVYTSPATVDRPEGVRTTRRPLFAGRPFTRRPYTTARTTQKVEEEEEEYSEEDIFDDEPEDELVVLPPNKLFSRRPSNDRPDENEADEEIFDEEEFEEDDEENVEVNKPTSRQPFKPRVVNSNTFRTSSFTTELPKQVLVATQNRTAILNRFATNKPVNETKKRVVNVPVGYNSPQPSTENAEKVVDIEKDTIETENAETTTLDNNTDITSEDDDYLTMTESTSTTGSDTETTSQDTSTSTNTDSLITSTEEMETDTSTDDYLEFDGETTLNPTTLDTTLHTSTMYDEPTTANEQTTVKTTLSNIDISTEATPETTSVLPKTPPIVKTQLDKLFSVSRVVEVSSKSEKHRLNKNNETRLIEEGVIMQEKKPTFDKIGEVSRFSLIKIFENEIPIYLTKLGHVYPVDNPPDNPIRIDEARNARALVNFNDGPRENLVASESINEAYRHVNKVTEKPKTENVVIVEQVEKKDTSQVEHVPNGDDFLSFINEENNGKTERPYTLQYYQPDPAQWQFIPAAYENEKNIEKIKMNKGAKSFEIVTPRNMLTDPSTLPLEGLFKTETPAMAKKVYDKTEKQPFVVYSVANDDSVNAKVSVVGGIIKTYVKGQELAGASVTEQATVKNPSPIFIQHQTTLDEAEITTSSMIETTETITTSPIMDMLTTQETSLTTEPTTIATTNEPTTVESIREETTTQKTSLFDGKRSKFAFPRRPIGLKSLNTTRSNSLANLNPNRVLSKKNTTLTSTSKRNSTLSSSFNKANKTTGFNPSKSRFSSVRAQNVPVDLKIKKFNSPKASQRSFSTEAPRTTTERRVSIKPIRPNLRPAFFPRRPSLATKVQKDRRNNFLRRTKATAPPDTTDTTEPITGTETIADTTTVTNRYTRRGNSKFKTPTGRKESKKDAKEVDAKKEENDDGGKIENRTRQPSSSGPKRSERPTRNYVRRRLGGANATSSSTRASTSTLATPLSSTLAATRRPFRVASRRRPLPTTLSTTGSTTAGSTTAGSTTAGSTTAGSTTTTTLGTTTLASDESLQDIEDRESIEDPALKPQTTPSLKKTVKIQRRPLTSLKEFDQNPSATNEDRKGMAKEDDRKRQSKKYSASFKQNQLDEVLRQKSKSQEELDVTTTDGTTDNDYSAETAVAIAAHQLLSAPLPLSDSIFDDQGKITSKKSTQKSNSFQTTQDYRYTTEYDTDDIPIPGRKSPVYSSTPGPYSSTPIYRTSFAEVRNPSYSPNPAPGFSSTVIPLGGYSSGPPKTSGYSSTPGYASTREYSNTPRLSSFGSTPSQRPSGFTPTGFIGNGYSLSPSLGPSTARYLETSNKYVAVPVDEYGYTGGLSQEPSYFTREYLLESPVTKTYDDEYQYLSPITTPPSATTRKSLPKKTVYKRISTTIRPTEAPRPVLASTTTKPRRTPQKKPFEKIAKPEVPNRTYRPIDNYDYYDDSQEKVHDKYAEGTKVVVHGKGVIQCLDIGNFPHPTSCKKFISCARMESGSIIGWEYVCPQGLSFDPVGGICNWSAGLGCQES